MQRPKRLRLCHISSALATLCALPLLPGLRSPMIRTLCLSLALAWLLPSARAQAPATTPTAPATPVTPVTDTQRSVLPTLQLPELKDIKLPMPRSVRAANALIGLARQRLALVVGNASAGALAAAPRDTQAVAAALRAGGFVVMVREDLGAEDLRANLKEFRERLQPGGVGFVYYTGLAAQLDGRNYVLPRGLALDAKGIDARLRSAAVPLQEIVDAVQGTADSPRYLVVDAAYAHPALATLAAPGLAEQTVQPGTMALFASAPGTVTPPPAADALPAPLPTDPRQIAASPFGRELVRALVTPRVSGPDVLRLTRGAMLDVSQGKQAPVIVGETDSKDEFAEPNLLDTLFPRTPEDLAREALKQALRLGTAHGAGDMPVSELLAQPPAPASTPATPSDKNNTPPDTKRTPESPTNGLPNAPLASTAAALAEAAAATAVNAATTAATATAAAKVAEVSAAASLASTAVAVAGNVASMMTSSSAGSAGAGEVPVAALAQPMAAAPAAPVPNGLPAATARSAVPDSLVAQEVAQQLAGTRPAKPADERTQQQQGGGERPVYVPRVNPFGYAEGDTFMYRVLDTWKDQVIGSMVQAIDEVLPDGQLRANGHQTEMDAQGRIKSTRNLDGSTSRFQPYQDLWWSNPKRGESRDVKFNEFFERADRSRGQTEWKGSLSVGRPRKIQTPAGEFDVLPIEGSGWYYEKSRNGLVSGQWSRTVWYAPKLGHPVAIDIEDANALGKLLRRERVELTHAQTSRPQ